MKLFYIFIFSAFTSFSQDSIPCNCCELEYQQFDFWIGNWNVYDTSGALVGTNNILSLQDNCAIQENWASAAMTGTSYSYYNKSDSSWNQIWIDNKGGSLVLKGSIQNRAMIMKSELLPGAKVDFYYNQITWTPNADGSVTQQWDIFDKNDVLLTTAFLGNYIKNP